jgi:4-carboxymuconolactone decarboxylase
MTGSLHDRPGAEVSPYLVDLSESLLYGDIWQRAQLSKRDRSLVTVGVLIALNRQPELREHLGRALENGVTHEELGELILHMAFYAGWPAAATAVRVAHEVFTED